MDGEASLDTARPEAGVEAEVDYVQPRFTHSFHYVGDGHAINTAEFETHRVFVRDARRAAEPLTLESAGFQLVPHHSEADFYADEATVVARYVPEIEALLRRVTGADQVCLFNWKRRDVARGVGDVYRAATDVHVDSDPATSRARATRLLEARGETLDGYRRFMNINVWRALSPPPQDRPLAVCHGLSLGRQSGCTNRSMNVEKMPPRDQMLKERPKDAEPRDGFLFHYDPGHRWFYFPDMTRDEALLFKLYDSAETGAWRCPHVSFLDASAAGAVPRESYEIRSVCCFR